jgi:hypothetical protein
MKHLQLPSGLQSGLPMIIEENWSTEQVVAVTELLQDLLHVIHSRYQGKLYAHWKVTRITQFEVDASKEDGESF